MRFLLILSLALLLLPTVAFAGAGITYHGRLIDPNGVPVISNNVQFKLQIRTPGNENCLMYEEVQAKDLSQASGAFAVTINDGTGTRLDVTGYSLDQIFANRNSFTFAGGNCASGSTYAPNASDSRKIQVLFNDGTFAVGLWEPVPPMAINFVPMAIESMQVGGYKKEQLLKIADGVGTAGTELNAAAWTELQALIAGSSTQFIKPGSATFTAAPVWSGTPSTADDLTNKSYVDAQVAAALPNVGTPGTYTKVTTDAKGRVIVGLSLLEADLPNITTAGKVAGGAINAGTISGTAAINTSGNLYTTGTVTGLTVSSTNLRVYNGANYVELTAPSLSGINVLFKLPAADGTTGQVLKTDGAGNLSWLSPVVGATLASGKVWIGSASNAATEQTLSGDITSVTDTGVVTTNKTTTGQSNKLMSLDGSGIATSMANQLNGLTSGSVTLVPAALTTTYSVTLPAGQGSSGQTLSNNGSGVLSWVTPANGSLSGLTAASAGHTIDNLNFAQTWNWSTATTQHPLVITADALTTGSLLKLTTSSASVNSTNGLLNVANTSAATAGVLARFQANSTASSGMTILNSGGVGIGTVSPTSKLQVIESANSGTLRTAFEIGAEESSAGSGVAMDFSQGGIVTGRIANIYESVFNIGMGFSTYNIGSLIERMRISADGNIGIGTSAPTTKLHVNGVGDVFKVSGSQAAFYIDNSTNLGVTFKTDSSTQGYYFTDGNVGIGTTSPGATLDVKGHIANSGASASVGTCGASPAISGNDMRGLITLGTGSPTACTITFAAAYASTPYCVITPVGGNPGAIQWWVTPSTSDLVMSFSASPTASQQFAYHCVQ